MLLTSSEDFPFTAYVEGGGMQMMLQAMQNAPAMVTEKVPERPGLSRGRGSYSEPCHSNDMSCPVVQKVF